MSSANAYTYMLYGFLLVFSFHSVAQESTKTVVLDNLSITYHFMDEDSVHKEAEMSELADKAFAAFTTLFGGLPRDEAGREYSEVSLHVKKGRYLGGEADPRWVMLTWSDEKQFGFATWETLLLHELFHLWSAESFRYKDGSEHWFNEGFAEFYSYKVAVNLGLISPAEMLTIASSVVGYYGTASRLEQLSMRAAGQSNKLKFENYFLVYHGGWTMAMALDHDIRKRTNNARSIDDLMRWMYENYPRHKKLYGLEDMIVGLKTSTGINYGGFVKSYVDGREHLPVSQYLPLGDAIWAFTFNQSSKENYSLLYNTLGF